MRSICRVGESGRLVRLVRLQTNIQAIMEFMFFSKFCKTLTNFYHAILFSRNTLLHFNFCIISSLKIVFLEFTFLYFYFRTYRIALPRRSNDELSLKLKEKHNDLHNYEKECLGFIKI